MKQVLYAGLLLVGLMLGGSRAGCAQAIPNNGFETWATRGTGEAPANWLTTDNLIGAGTSGQLPNSGTVTKSTDAHGGSFAAKLTSTTLTSSSGSAVVEGILILGTKLGGQVSYAGYPIGGIPCAVRPTQLQLYYKFTGPAADAPITTLLLTKTGTNGALPTIVGGGVLALTPTTGGYTAVTVNIPYNTTDTPDSLRIQFSSGTAATITAGSTLLVDDISLLGAALAVRASASLQELLTVAPNPSPAGRFVISSPAQPALAAAPLTVFDMLGREVVRQPAQLVPTATRELDLSGMPVGIYTLRLDSKQGALVRQLVVK